MKPNKSWLAVLAAVAALTTAQTMRAAAPEWRFECSGGVPNKLCWQTKAGNVGEWCWDWYDWSYYTSSPGTDPRGPLSGLIRVIRGGDWSDCASYCRAANRINYVPGYFCGYVGFRVAQSSVRIFETRVIELAGDLAFGEVGVGSTASRPLTIDNKGDVPLHVTGIQLPPAFTANQTVKEIPPGESQTIDIVFLPTAIQDYDGTITVLSDKTGGETTIMCSGLGIDPSHPSYGFVLIPAGEFLMGDQSDPLAGYPHERPVHSVYVSDFYMAKHEMTKVLWDEVSGWAAANGYDINTADASGKGKDHPVCFVTWYECVKWCNACTEYENATNGTDLTPCYTVSGAVYRSGSSSPVCNRTASGYRLPTEAEWEKAARGGMKGQNFPWGDTIAHSQANYNSDSFISNDNDVSPTQGYHPKHAKGKTPHTAPGGSFAPNGYGLYDMAGNVGEWCWDWYGSYPADSQADPCGPATGSDRVARGGGWNNGAYYCRVADRSYGNPGGDVNYVGFRPARSSGP